MDRTLTTAPTTPRQKGPPPGTLAEELSRLETTSAGLTTDDAAARRSRLGSNEAVEPHWAARLLGFARPLLSPLVLILLVAGLASAFLGQRADAAIILAMVFLSTLIDVWQTKRSERAVRQLQATIAPTASVLRDGTWAEIPRTELVPGDVVRLSAGDLVPADCRLLEARDLHVQQGALTGESLPAEKAPITAALEAGGPSCPALVFLGTSVVSGTATAVVQRTGARTAFGDVLSRLGARPDETEFERGMRNFGLLILKTVFFLVLFILVVNVSLGRNALESLLFSVALAVGLTPEFLPIITTVTLSEGAVRMAREKVIVKHLSAIQNLGSIDILCSDKTGTLTSGAMTLDAALDPVGNASARSLSLAALNSRFETGIKSPLDAAILARCGADAGSHTKTDEIPFDFERRRLSVVVRDGERHSLITKGAPESVLATCTHFESAGRVTELDATARQAVMATFSKLSAEGFRVLAVAERPVDHPDGYTARDERNMTLVGFLTFADHLLEGVAPSVAGLRRDGVRVKILTGDNELVTAHVCRQAGIEFDRVVLGDELESLDTPALAKVAEDHDVFARVSPAGKHRLIRALKAKGHTVGFLGDGINDAPSLHGADVGISVFGAVDVAREAADIVLLEKRLTVLHAGIMAGRRSFANVLKYLLMGTSSNFGNMFSMAGATLFLPFLPMLPTQLLLNNFLYDLSQITIPTDKVDPDYLDRPQHWDVKLIRRFMLVLGPLSSIYDFLTFYL
ncbi:MAG TPA: magnesium-translocating P-type ATPase, partial [Polyangiaceae bacterium]|nr:magnesium-translocating P-type ATPase [Polyangiaceae bacterium]